MLDILLKPFLTSFFISFFTFPFFIRFTKNFTVNTREFFTPSHVEDKKNVPFFGGVLIAFVSIGCSLFFFSFKSKIILPVLFCALSFGLLGFFDDYLKLKKKYHFTIKTSSKLKLQFLLAFITVCMINFIQEGSIYDQKLILPLFKTFVVDFSFLYFLMRIFAITGTINGVNLTDGLDGLVSVPLVMNLISFGGLASLLTFYPAKISVPLVKDNYYDIVIYCTCLTGTLLGFLKYNYKPAKIFMGDTGSLFSGGSLAACAVSLKQEFLLVASGMLFIIEVASSFIQIYSIRFRGKKVFKMSPIHHHFEFYGWSEKKIVFVFWAVSFLFFILASAAAYSSYIKV